MKKFSALGAAVLAASMALVPSAFANDNHRNSSEPNLYFSPEGDSGVWDLGVDITQAGGSPASVRAFLAAQPPRTQEILYTACQDRVAHPVGHLPPIVSFCRTALGL
jgi:hypothetical protein